MAGKPGMTGNGLGGRREGAGRPRRRFTLRVGDTLICERETIGGVIQSPARWVVLGVSPDEIEFQSGDDIIVLRRPDDRPTQDE